MPNNNVAILSIMSKFDEKSAREAAKRADKVYEEALSDIGNVNFDKKLIENFDKAMNLLKNKFKKVNLSSYTNSLLDSIFSDKDIKEKSKDIELFVNKIEMLKKASSGQDINAFNTFSAKQIDALISRTEKLAQKQEEINEKTREYNREATKIAKANRSISTIDKNFGNQDYSKTLESLKKSLGTEKEFTAEQNQSIENLAKMVNLYQAMEKSEPQKGTAEAIRYSKDLLAVTQKIKEERDKIDAFSKKGASTYITNNGLSSIDKVSDYTVSKSKEDFVKASLSNLKSQEAKLQSELTTYISESVQKNLAKVSKEVDAVVDKAEKRVENLQNKIESLQTKSTKTGSDNSIIGGIVSETDIKSLEEIEDRLYAISDLDAEGEATKQQLKEYIQLYKQYEQLVASDSTVKFDPGLKEEYDFIVESDNKLKKYAGTLDETITKQKELNAVKSDEYSTSVDTQTEQLVKQEEQIKETIQAEKQLQDTQEKVFSNTKISVDAEQAIVDINKIKESLDSIPEEKNIKITISDSDYTNTPLLSDAEGNTITAFRGVVGAWSGLINQDGIGFFTDKLKLAADYADSLAESGKVYQANLSFKNPLEVEGNGAKWDEIDFNGVKKTTDEIVELAKQLGHDGVIFKNIRDGFTDTDEDISNVMVALNAAQIKNEQVIGTVKAGTGEMVDVASKIDNATDAATNSTVESQNKIQEELKETDESIQKILYHYGLLSSYNGGKKSHQFGDEVTAYKEGKSNGGRGWADGTGTYVTNDATEFSKITTTEDFKKFFALDASKLKMYEAHIEEEAKKFYEFQHKLEQFVLALGSGYTGFDDNISDVTSESLYAEAKSVFAKYPEIFNRVFKDFEDFDAFIDKMINLVSESGMNENGFESKNARKLMEFKKNNGIDDIKTRFLKELGFQGTDLSGTSYGGIQSGSVIFDIDTAPIIASGKTIKEVLDEIGIKAEDTKYKIQEELKDTQKQAEQTSEALSKIGDTDKSNISSDNSNKQLLEGEEIRKNLYKINDEIGLSEEEFIQKLRQENEEVKNGNRQFQERLALLKDGKVVASYFGDKASMNIHNSDLVDSFDKVIHSHSPIEGSSVPSFEDLDLIFGKYKSEIKDFVLFYNNEMRSIQAPGDMSLLGSEFRDYGKFLDAISSLTSNSSIYSNYANNYLASIAEEAGVAYKQIDALGNEINSQRINTSDWEIILETMRQLTNMHRSQNQDAEFSQIAERGKELSNTFIDSKNSAEQFEISVESLYDILIKLWKSVENDGGKTAFKQLREQLTSLSSDNIKDILYGDEMFYDADGDANELKQVAQKIYDNYYLPLINGAKELKSETNSPIKDVFQGDDIQNIESKTNAIQNQSKAYREWSDAIKYGIDRMQKAKELHDAGLLPYDVDNGGTQRINRDKLVANKIVTNNALEKGGSWSDFSNASEEYIKAVLNKLGMTSEQFHAQLKAINTIETTDYWKNISSGGWIRYGTSNESNVEKATKELNYKIYAAFEDAINLTKENISDILNRLQKEGFVGQLKTNPSVDTIGETDQIVIHGRNEIDQKIAYNVLKAYAEETGKNFSFLDGGFDQRKPSSKSFSTLLSGGLVNIDEYKEKLQETRIEAEKTSDALDKINNTDTSKTTREDVYQGEAEKSGMDDIASATKEAVQTKKDFATANEGVQSSIDGSKSPLQLEAELMDQIAKSARESANAKKEFVEANKQVKNSVADTNEEKKRENTEENTNAWKELIYSIQRYSEVSKRISGGKALEGDIEEASRLENKISQLQKIDILSPTQIEKSEQMLTKLYDTLDDIEKKSKETTLESLNSSIDKYRNDYNSRSSKPFVDNQSDKYKKLLADYETSIKELEAYRDKISNNPLVSKEDLNQIDELIKKVKESSTAFNSLTASQKGSTPLSRGKTIEWANDLLEQNSKWSKKAKIEVQGWINKLATADPSNVEEIRNRILEVVRAEREAGNAGKTWLDIFSTKKLHHFLGQAASMFSFYDLVNVGREGFQTIRELDTALTEMKKVSDETTQSLKNYQATTFDVGDAVGATAKTIQASTADYMRLGESINESAESAKASNILLNVSEFESIDEATESLVAMSQAYSELDKMDIIDVLNNIGNNYSIATDGLATALQKSASALKTANNDLNSAVALATAGNAVVQDPDSVGAGIRTISLRLVGTEAAKQELESIGEETDDVITTTSKLRDTILSATAAATNDGKGFDILDSNGNYKSTYEIMQGLADLYDDIVAKDKELGTNNLNLLLETIAGKNRSNIAASILQNGEMLRSVYQDAQNSSGSAQKELDSYLDSIDGRMTQLENRAQEFWYKVIDSDAIKNGITLLTDLLELGTNIVDTFGVLGTTATIGSGILGATGHGLTNYVTQS